MPRTHKGECVYCGEFGPITRDHVISECLFDIMPDDNSVVTVPSCTNCQKQKNKDEAYFAHRMFSDHRLSNHPVVSKLGNKMMRAARRRQSDMAADFINTSVPGRLETESGIDIGIHHQVVLKLARLNNVARFMVRGLYFDMMGYRLPDDYQVLATEDNRTTGRVLLTQDLVKIILEGRRYEKHMADVFSAYCAPSPEDAKISLWLMVFYGKIAYLGITINNILADAADPLHREPIAG